jgi:hypothetical protein
LVLQVEVGHGEDRDTAVGRGADGRELEMVVLLDPANLMGHF